jgi:hypothetical protein
VLRYTIYSILLSFIPCNLFFPFIFFCFSPFAFIFYSFSLPLLQSPSICRFGFNSGSITRSITHQPAECSSSANGLVAHRSSDVSETTRQQSKGILWWEKKEENVPPFYFLSLTFLFFTNRPKNPIGEWLKFRWPSCRMTMTALFTFSLFFPLLCCVTNIERRKQL